MVDGTGYKRLSVDSSSSALSYVPSTNILKADYIALYLNTVSQLSYSGAGLLTFASNLTSFSDFSWTPTGTIVNMTGLNINNKKAGATYRIFINNAGTNAFTISNNLTNLNTIKATWASPQTIDIGTYWVMTLINNGGYLAASLVQYGVSIPNTTTLNNKLNITDGTNAVEITSTNVSAGGTTIAWSTILTGGNQTLQQVLNNGSTSSTDIVLSNITASTITTNTYQGTSESSALTIGANLSGGSVALGTGTSTTTLNGVTTFTRNPLISSSALANNNNTSNIATTAWVNTYWSYVKSISNTWSSYQYFSTAVQTSIIAAYTTTANMTVGGNLSGGTLTLGSANAITTALGAFKSNNIQANSIFTPMYVGNNLIAGGSVQIGTALSTNTLNGVTTFNSQPLISSATLLNTDNTSNIATTAWVNNYWSYVKGISNTWTTSQAFSTTISANSIQAYSATTMMMIGNNLSSTGGSISLGNSNVSTTVLGTFLSNSYNGTATNSAVTLGANLSDGSLTIGSANVSTTVLGTLLATSYNGPATNSEVTIGSNLVSGSLTLGSANVSTTVLGTLLATSYNGPATNSAVTIGSNLSGGTLALGSGTSTTTLNGVTTFTSQPLITSAILSSTNNSTNIATTAWVNSWYTNILLYVSNIWSLSQTFAGGLLTNSIGTVAITDNLALASTQTSGSILIGNRASRTGGIVIGGNGATAFASMIIIGSSTTSCLLNGSTVFSRNPTITPFLSNSDNSSSIPTTSWVRTYIGATLANISSTIGNASLINGSTLSILTINGITQTAAMTVGSNLSGGSLTIGSLNASTIVRGPTTFLTNPIISSSLSTADNSSRVPTTAWVKTYFATFTSTEILNTLYAGTAYIVTGTAYLSKIQANSSTSVFSICDNLTSGSLSIGSSTASNTILGTTTFINNPLVTSPLSVTDNSSSVPTTAWVNSFFASYATPQILSTIYAGTAYVVTGTVYTNKLQANSSTAQFNLCDNLTTGSLSIGTDTSTTTILGTFKSDNHQGVNISSAMTIGKNLSGGSLTIGSSNSSTIFNSCPLINAEPLLTTDNSSRVATTSWIRTNFGSLNSTNVWSSNQAFGTYIQTSDLLALYSAPLTLYGNTSSTLSIGSLCSSITIGDSQTSGSINIGTATNTNTINGVTTFTSQPLISSALLPHNTSTNAIATTSWVQSHFGNVSVSSNWKPIQYFQGGLLSNYLGGYSPTATLSIGGNLTGIGTVFIGSSTTASRILGTANVSVLNSSTARFNTIDSNVSTLNIGTTNVSTINMGRSNTDINIASSSSRTADLDLGNGASSTGSVIINNGSGSSGSTQIMNASTQSGSLILGNSGNTVTIALNRPLTPGYTYSATGTGSGRVGEILKVGPFAQTVNAGTPTSLAFMDIPRGVWVLQGSSGTAGNGSGYNFLGFSTVNNTLQFLGSCNIPGGAYDYNLNANWTISLTSTTRYYLVSQFALTSYIPNINFQAIRIA
jgi:hypothetical protein